MAVLWDISSRLLANEDKLNGLTSRREAQALAEEPEPTTSISVERRGQTTTTTHDGRDTLHRVEDHVCASIASHPRGPLAAFLPTTDEESGSDEDASALSRRKAKG